MVYSDVAISVFTPTQSYPCIQAIHSVIMLCLQPHPLKPSHSDWI